jgi:hypothetical protein
MNVEKNRRLCIFLAVGLASCGLGGCSPSPDGSPGTGGAGSGGTGNGTGGAAATGGSQGSGGSGAQGTAGSGGTGGSSSGGTTGSGGTSSTGGAGPGGSGGDGAGGGDAGRGGMSGSGGGAGTGGGSAGRGGTGGGGAGTGGSSAGGGGRGGSTGGRGGSTGGGGSGTGGSGTCQKGQTKGSDVVIMGESFYAIAPQYIQNRLQDNARQAGSLGASDKYRNVAVSGQNMNYIATTEWTAATQGGATVKWVIMDGGGIDCLTGSSCPTCMSTFKTLLGKMATAGVQEVIYTRYPEPGAPPGSNASLKACLDSFQPGMQTACEGSTSPKCHWVDLRPVFVAGDTTDGLHPTQSGGNHVGDLIWSEMVKECFAQ